MASKAKNIANRENAQHSTGPRTQAGKQASRYNRTCHGLAGKQVVIHTEDAAAYDALRADLIEAYDPANNAELALVEEVAQNFWRIQRGRALEAETFKLHSSGADPIIGFQCGRTEFETLRRYMGAIERAYHRALTQLGLEQKARRQREAEAAAIAPAPPIRRSPIHAVPPRPAIPTTLPAKEPPPPPEQSTPLLPAGTPPPS